MKTQKTFSPEAPTNMPKSFQSQFMSMLCSCLRSRSINIIFSFISSEKLLQIFIWGRAVVFHAKWARIINLLVAIICGVVIFNH